MKILLIILIPVVLFSCKEVAKVEKIQSLTAQEIIDKAIDNSCQGNCESAQIEFTFRDRTYKSTRNEGKYQLERTKIVGEDTIQDFISNEGLKRYINEIETIVNDTMITRISDGVNSVHYFAQLPFGLNNQAVQKKLIGEDSINNNNYYEIEVTFKEEGGGTDFDDVFVYWIHKQDFTVDYLSYRYAVNGGGIRFREAYNARVINGIRFVDYNNYKPESKEIMLSDLDSLFIKGKLKLLSKIETENITVSLLD
ncbi:MAG: hypothetical protein ACI93N_001528 [Flavobacteriaceae bacterium]|jgi:hypothetical protein